MTFLRPLLDVCRATTPRKACAALGLPAWEDPHNTDPAYARSRVRATALPALVEALGPGVVANLARTARLVAADAEALDALAEAALADARTADGAVGRGAARRCCPRSRTRVLHAWALRSAARRRRCRTGTSTRWTRWSPTGAVRGRPTCPAG